MTRLARLVAVLIVLVGRPLDAHADQVLELRLSTGPHAPGEAPDVVVHVPSHFDAAQQVELLVFLHGFSSCARALLADQAVACNVGGTLQRGYGLASIHEQARTNSLLVVPQLAFLARQAGSPRFARAGGFDAFTGELLDQLRERLGGRPKLRGITLLAHSAGYRAAAQVLADTTGGKAVQALVLFDALYADWNVFARWFEAEPSHRLISLYTRDPQTREGNSHLLRVLAAAGQSTGRLHDQLVVAEVATAHRMLPERHLLPVLRALFVSRDLPSLQRDAQDGAARPNVPAR